MASKMLWEGLGVAILVGDEGEEVALGGLGLGYGGDKLFEVDGEELSMLTMRQWEGGCFVIDGEGGLRLLGLKK